MNKREQGKQYREVAVRLLAQLGYATTRQVAKSVWGKCDNSTRKMAGRTLRWLLVSGYVVAKRDDNSVNAEQLVALTRKGAQWATDLGAPLARGKVHARDYLRHAHKHRTACNSVFVALPDGSLASELAVRSGLSPITNYRYSVDGEVFTKVPDLVLAIGKDRFEWIEVENSWRSDKDLVKVVDCMRALFWHPGGRVGRMHFVVTSPAAKTIGQRLKKAMTHGPESGWPRQVKEADARILAEHIFVSVLDHETLTLKSITI